MMGEAENDSLREKGIFPAETKPEAVTNEVSSSYLVAVDTRID